jgi:CRP-like cAMP-binding protein
MSMRSGEALTPLLMRLTAVSELNEAELDAILTLPFTLREVKAGWEIVREGDRPSQSCLVVNGVSCRFKILGDGARQIVSVHIRGDMPDLQSLFLEQMDHNLATMTPSLIALIQHRSLLTLIEQHPRIAGILWRESLIDGSIFREWIGNIGRRTAFARIAHLICEMFVRYRAMDANDGMAIPFAFTQTELGDAQGLSTVHINRVLKALKKNGLVSIRKKVLIVENWEELQKAGDFEPSYLHLRHPVSGLA